MKRRFDYNLVKIVTDLNASPRERSAAIDKIIDLKEKSDFAEWLDGMIFGIIMGLLIAIIVYSIATI